MAATDLAIVLVLCGAAFAETKTEADLRVTKAALAAAAKTNADLQKVVSASSRQSVAAVKASRNSTQAIQDSADSAAESAALARFTAEANAVIQKQSADQQIAILKASAEAQKSAADSARASARNQMIAGTFAFATLIAGFIWQAYTTARDRRWAQQDAAKKDIATTIHHAEVSSTIQDLSTSVQEQKGTIEHLEKNTNSIKDALVKVTGESEFAKGLKKGQEEG